MGNTLNITIDVPDQELKGVVITAVEGGIGYWARVRRYDPESGTVAIAEDDQKTAAKPGWHKIGPADILRGLQICATKYPHVFAHWHHDQIGDASSADVIVQCAIFGEAVYG